MCPQGYTNPSKKEKGKRGDIVKRGRMEKRTSVPQTNAGKADIRKLFKVGGEKTDEPALNTKREVHLLRGA